MRNSLILEVLLSCTISSRMFYPELVRFLDPAFCDIEVSKENNPGCQKLWNLLFDHLIPGWIMAPSGTYWIRIFNSRTTVLIVKEGLLSFSVKLGYFKCTKLSKSMVSSRVQ